MKVLTVRQPWAWLILHGGKDIENRSWPTNYRGPLAIHAAKGMTRQEFDMALDFVSRFDDELSWHMTAVDFKATSGAIIGIVEVRDCATYNDFRPCPPRWYMGPYAWILSDPKPCEPVYVKGKLGLWEWDGNLESE